jgi:hypothetical protein
MQKTMETKKMPFDLAFIAKVFKLERSGTCTQLDNWLNKPFELDAFEQKLLDKVHSEMLVSSNYLNEEEIKIRLIAPLFEIANIDVDNQIRVFYERPLTTEIDEYSIAVVCDCMVAASSIFKTPTHPYFFLQEFKKAKGEKKDPEAQMLLAMLAAQKENNDGKPIYGGFLIGATWNLAILVGREYCTSRQYFATDKQDLLQIIYALRQLKFLILNG